MEIKLSQLSETLIGSEIVKLGGEIQEKIRKGEKIYNYTIGDFNPSIFPIPKELEDAIVDAYRKHFTSYPAAEGNLDLREAIVSFTKDMEGLDYGFSETLVASGGRPLIYSLPSLPHEKLGIYFGVNPDPKTLQQTPITVPVFIDVLIDVRE